MNGSRLARGRMGRLALLGCVTVAVIIIIFAYKTTSAEMSRLRDLHVKCAQQQEALAAQLQVIYDYKSQLEKTLINEKNANAAAKEELQQKASHERSLRDKDSLEAMQRFNALQQNYKLLQTENQDLKDECKKKESQAQDNAKKLEELKLSKNNELEEKARELESFKNKHIEAAQEKEKLQEKLTEMSRAAEESAQSIQHLQKQVIQLQRELEDAKKASHFSVGGLKTENSILQRPSSNEALQNNNNNGDNKNHNSNNGDDNPGGQDKNPMQVIRPSPQQQVSSPSSALEADENPQPLQAPRERQSLDDPILLKNDNNNNNNNNGNGNANDNKIDEGPESDVGFASRDGNIVPVGPNDALEQQQQQQHALPLPYDLQQRRQSSTNAPPPQEQPDAQPRQVLAPPDSKPNNDHDDRPDAKPSSLSSSSTTKAPAPVLRPQAVVEPDNEPDPDFVLNDFDALNL